MAFIHPYHNDYRNHYHPDNDDDDDDDDYDDHDHDHGNYHDIDLDQIVSDGDAATEPALLCGTSPPSTPQVTIIFIIINISIISTKIKIQ